MNIEISNFNISKKSITRSFKHMQNGFITKSTKPIKVCRMVNKRVFVTDGHHRLIQGIFLKKKEFKVDMCQTQCELFLDIKNIQMISLNDTMKYNGLETTIQLDELDNLYNEVIGKL